MDSERWLSGLPRVIHGKTNKRLEVRQFESKTQAFSCSACMYTSRPGHGFPRDSSTFSGWNSQCGMKDLKLLGKDGLGELRIGKEKEWGVQGNQRKTLNRSTKVNPTWEGIVSQFIHLSDSTLQPMDCSTLASCPSPTARVTSPCPSSCDAIQLFEILCRLLLLPFNLSQHLCGLFQMSLLFRLKY